MALTCRGSATVYTSSVAAQMPPLGGPVSDVDGTETLLVADNKTIVPRARGATGNAVKSNAWDENEVLLEGEELVTRCSVRSLWASEASGPGGDAACARAGV